jgi:hypothetical protein
LEALRPFGGLTMELLSIAEPMVCGVLTGDWTRLDQTESKPKRFQETLSPFYER